MDEQRQRIVEDLTGTLSGEIRCDDVAVAMYASDASLFQIRPLGIAFPGDRNDVVTLARYSTETGTPLIARGAGTNLTGSSLGNGLVVDFSRHMRSIELIDEKSVTVQPGVVLDQLNQALRPAGRYFAPDPSTAAITTIGGMLGVDSAGSRAARVGSTRDYTRQLEVVLASGDVIDCGTEQLSFPRRQSSPFGLSISSESAADSTSQLGIVSDETEATASELKRTIVSKLAKLLADNRELINRHQPSMMRNTCGYFLRGVHRLTELNLPGLLVGSEGTLGLFTSATLNTLPLPEHRGVVLLTFGTMDQAIEVVQAVAPQQPSACDLLDRRLMTLGRENDSRFERFIPDGAEAGLLIEQPGFSEQQCRDRIAMAIRAARNVVPDVCVSVEAYDYDGVEFLWELPRKVVSLLARMKGATRPLPFVEDVAVPPETLAEFFTRGRELLQKNNLTASVYSHAASGQIHIRPFLPLPTPADGPRMTDLAEQLCELTWSLGGTISGEHGDGLSRSCFVERQYGPLYRVFRQIKEIFDPHNLLNPGRVITEQSVIPAAQFRPQTPPDSQLVQLKLNWRTEDVADVTDACNGCGTCRTQRTELRMCPFFRDDPSEEASPRSSVNLMRALQAGQLGPTTLASPEFHALTQKCFNCRQCELECPTSVRVPHLMMEAKAQAIDAAGLDRATWTLSRVHSFGRLGCRISLLINRLLSTRSGRWLLEKVIGIHRNRQLPKFASRSFISSLSREQTNPSLAVERGAVVYFVDHFANYHDPQLAEAFLAILDHNNIPVHIPESQNGSGMAMLSAGDLDAARSVAEDNVRELADLAREGLTIVCTEPTAALCLSQDYPVLLDHPDVTIVAKQTVEAGAYLKSLHTTGRLRTDFTPLPLRVGYHTPCHLKALNVGQPLKELLELVPELDVVGIENGCSGMAGTFGLSTTTFDESLRIGRELIERVREPDLIAATSECSSCRLQMQQGTDTPAVHPLKLLAAAYGLADSPIPAR
ncbi:MAG: FAD-linked oxidase C-terminal domain-containing protein [Planctomycetota bacterium]